MTGADYTVAIISGPFTQAGNISIIDKFTKAQIAIENGVDLVIELPQIYATASAKHFANGAITLLNKLNIVDYVCFGSECDNIDLLQSIANKIVNNESILQNEISKLDKNISYAQAREIALSKILNEDELAIIKNSNDILGIEYLISLIKQNSTIKPFCIKRDNKFISATNIRENLKENNFDNVKNFVPNNTYEYISKDYILNEDIFQILKYIINTKDISELKNINGICDGLENKIKKEIINSTNYEDFIFKIKSKRYQLSRIKRLIISILLNITQEDFDYAIQNNIQYIRILKCNENGKKLLSQISKKSSLDLITSLNQKSLKKTHKDTLKYINMDIHAQNIYSIIKKEETNKDYTNKI